ncbi:MAG TPA: hypothetical protein VLT60_05080 [Usitatibacter sp.]|nr:hypothetical protein [Usitatibacter sp.]
MNLKDLEPRNPAENDEAELEPRELTERELKIAAGGDENPTW